MKSFVAILLALVSFFGLSLAQGQNQPVKEWTVLVYLNADNDLYRFSSLNMAQMEAIGSTGGVNIVVQLDPEPKKMPTSRYYITKSPAPKRGRIASEVVERLPETDMGNPKTLSDFLIWGVQKYPAKKYAVIIWNHGNGWQGISYDDNPQSNLSIPDVRAGLEAMNSMISQQRQARVRAPQIDIINFDACLMSTLEVAFELKDVAKYLVGSQFNEPGEGEDYSAFLGPVVAKPTMTGRELAEVMVYQYTLYHKQATEINYAAIDLSRVANFTTQFNSTIAVTNASAAKAQVQLAFGAGSFDLVTGLNAARNAASIDANAARAYDVMIANYGYPKEGVERGSAQRSIREIAAGLTITRFVPSELYYRNANSGPFQRALLQKSQRGIYEIQLPTKPLQYYVVSAVGQGGRELAARELAARELAAREALSTFVRNDNNPIVFHNQFPETSPLVADSYSLYTHGAHGMTLYSLAGMTSAKNPTTQTFGRDMLSMYKQLLFARNGAPNWTLFFGL